jgi:hypothetical protein
MTEWSAYKHYTCIRCLDICINHTEMECTHLELCSDCTQRFRHKGIIQQFKDALTQLPDSTTATSERAEGATPSHGGPTDRVSASPRAERRGESQRESPEPAGSPERGAVFELSAGTVVHRPADD